VKEHKIKAFLMSEGYCHERLTPGCVQDAIDDLYDEFQDKCESPDENSQCQKMFDLISSLERTKLFLEKYANR